MPHEINHLFSYGTLREERAQQAILGKKLSGTPDTLTGFRITHVQICDSRLATVIEDARWRVNGILFQLDPEDWQNLDQYETSLYEKLTVRLESGLDAIVYALKCRRNISYL